MRSELGNMIELIFCPDGRWRIRADFTFNKWHLSPFSGKADSYNEIKDIIGSSHPGYVIVERKAI